MAQCSAKSKTTGQRCKQPCVVGSTKCHYHGGSTPKGVASPNMTTGRYSKYLPSRLLDRYHEAEGDGELLSLRSEIALTDGRLADLLSRVDSGEAKSLWEKARKLNQDIQKDVHNENYGALMVHAAELDFIIGTGLTDHEAWYEIHAILDQRRKLAESERKRLIESQQMVKTEQAMTLATALLLAVKESVQDSATLMKVQSAFNRLLQSEVSA